MLAVILEPHGNRDELAPQVVHVGDPPAILVERPGVDDPICCEGDAADATVAFKADPDFPPVVQDSSTRSASMSCGADQDLTCPLRLAAPRGRQCPTFQERIDRFDTDVRGGGQPAWPLT
jgi:hypothetical protein